MIISRVMILRLRSRGHVGGPIHEVGLDGIMVEKEGAPLSRLHAVLNNKFCLTSATEICLAHRVGARNSEPPGGHHHLDQDDLKCHVVGNGNAHMLQEVASSPAWDVPRKKQLDISVITSLG